ncbi:MAG: hypothetical protein K9H64_09090 [Bacteroidales bacterium]|nr:hypothetical protein [Bacteroidales bacterium]MCF8456021.1 hypothetical protein [Bacteroidales bacterium]
MRTYIAFVLVVFLGLSCNVSWAQEDTDPMSKLLPGTILTLKEDHYVKSMVGVIEIESDSENYKIFNIVFDSKDKERMMRKGTQFVVKEIEVGAGFLKIHIKNKVNYVYFGKVIDLKQLKISSLRKVFDIQFPSIEDF